MSMLEQNTTAPSVATEWFENEPDNCSVIVHSLPSNDQSEGLQALLLFDVKAYDANLCKEVYTNLGLPQPPNHDHTVRKIQEHMPDLQSFAFLQDVNKGMGFVQQNKSLPSNSMVITTSAYLNLLQFFSVPQNINSEWHRLCKKFQTNMDSMRSHLLPITLGPYLSFLSHGRTRFRKTLEVYPESGFELAIFVYAESKWTPDKEPTVIMRYTQLSHHLRQNHRDYSHVILPTGSVRLFPQVCQTLSKAGIPFLQKQINPCDAMQKCTKSSGAKSRGKGYFTTSTSPPEQTPLLLSTTTALTSTSVPTPQTNEQIQPFPLSNTSVASHIKKPAPKPISSAVKDILAQAAFIAGIHSTVDAASASTLLPPLTSITKSNTKTGAAPTKSKSLLSHQTTRPSLKLQKSLEKAGLLSPLSSSSSSSNESDSSDNEVDTLAPKYSMPVLGSITSPAGSEATASKICISSSLAAKRTKNKTTSKHHHNVKRSKPY